VIKATLYPVAVLGLLLLALLAGLRVGSFDSDYREVLEALFQYDPANQLHFAIVHLRLPRLLLALVVGAALAFSGYLMQAMVNNGLADPYLLGTASGASLGATLAFFWLPSLTVGGIYLPPLAALAGALGVTVVVVVLGYRKGQLLPTQLLLAGIALSSLAAALVALFTFLSDSEGKLRSVVFWTMGGFDKASWSYLGYPTGAILVALLLFSFLQKHLHILLLGPERAHTLGVNVVRVRWLILLTVSLVTGFAVALAGPIGFVGLIIPHVTRSMMGVTGKNNLLFCALTGGLFMVCCDLLSRLLYPPAGLPVGIITAFFGVPFFVYLLVRKNYRFQ
jgi:iron complex transport system permease protein